MAKNRRYLALFLAVVIAVSAGCSNNSEVNPAIEEQAVPSPSFLEADEEKHSVMIGDKLPITRGLAVKMAVLTVTDKRTLEAYDRQITFTDTDENQWYDKYINGAYILGLISGSDQNTFSPDEPLTLQQAQSLLINMNPETKLKIKIDDENKDKSISYALWCQIFTQALEELAEEENFQEYFGINETSFVVLASKGNHSLLPEGTLITDKGPYFCEGITGDYYIDMEVGVLEKEGEILAVTSIVSEEPVIKNAYVADVSQGNITVFSGGAERTYAYQGGSVSAVGKLCNIKINAGYCIGIELISETAEGKILAVSEEQLELKDHPYYPVSKNFKVYSTAEGSVKWKDIRSLTVGAESVKFFINDGQIAGAVVQEVVQPEKIRVVIGNSEFDSLIHDTVEITATDNFTVTGNGESKTYAPGEVVTFNAAEDIDGSAFARIFIETGERGRIVLKSILRNTKEPEYRGVIEIGKNNDGFIIVNEVDIEEYLYSVVPSEMPVSYGLEALKAQAVTARSYAYNQFYANKFHVLGGNVDDSVISQVYNNTAENEISTQAVNETRGECLVYDGEVISANFYSTSSGMTANNGEVWADVLTREFPAETSPYLQSKALHFGGDYGDLSVEENAAVFLKDWNVEGYDSNVSWFRWKLEMTNEELSRTIGENLQQVYDNNPALLKTLQQDGTYKSVPVEGIGSVRNIEVLSRGAGGNITSLLIEGMRMTILVETEYAVRTLLRPVKYDDGSDIVIQRKDGTEIANYPLLPSGFFAMERMTDGEGNILSVRFYGGGNGHGAGMSQNAAKGMVDSGMTYAEVLTYFYDGTQINQVY